MNKAEARRLVGRRPKWELRAQTFALCCHPWRNTAEDWSRLEACYTLLKTPYNRRVAIPNAVSTI